MIQSVNCYACGIKIHGRHVDVRSMSPNCTISRVVVKCANGHKMEVGVEP